MLIVENIFTAAKFEWAFVYAVETSLCYFCNKRFCFESFIECSKLIKIFVNIKLT